MMEGISDEEMDTIISLVSRIYDNLRNEEESGGI